jgi:hypothetical protein
MPWRRAKALPPPDNTLFEACFRIQREAIDAAGGRFIPLVVENVCGVQPFVGRARWHYGSFYLWGDVPALMPLTTKRGVKVGGLDWSSPDRAKRGCFRDSAIKNTGGSGFAVAHNTTSGKGRNPDGRGVKNGGRAFPNDCAEARTDLEVKCGGDWFWKGANASLMRRQASKSSKRKLASALIAKIPRPLSRWIGKAWFPA